MANFKVGQRVRVLPTPNNPWTDEATITGFDPVGTDDSADATWIVKADHHPSGCFNRRFRNCWWCEPQTLAPLTDPAADAFVERMKRLERESAPRITEAA